MLWTELTGAQLRAQLPRHPLRMPRRAHLGEEVMGLAKLAGASRGVFEQPGQRCVLDVDQGSPRASISVQPHFPGSDGPPHQVVEHYIGAQP